MSNILSNAFSLQMIKDLSHEEKKVSITPVKPQNIPSTVESAIGHADTAKVVEGMLGFPVPANRVNIVLDENDILFVAQLKGGRLPEGATTLPEGFEIEFFRVEILR